jgi:hypothetical protein
MEYRLKIVTIIVGLTLVLSGCKDLPVVDELFGGQPNAGSSGRAQHSGIALAAQSDASQRKQVQLIVPNDKQTAAAIEEALPTIKKVLGIHPCLKDSESVRLMNIYAVPGVNLATGAWYIFPNNTSFLKYHDRNKCVSVSTIDQWAMPALNALQFRVVYFADDSGETVNFQYLFKKVDDGSWKIDHFDSITK